MSEKSESCKKQQKQKKKPRTEQILATVTATHDGMSFEFDLKTDKVVLPDCKVESIHQRSFYNRSSGKEKTLNSTPSAGSDGYFNQMSNLRSNFDYLFAADTNTVSFKGKRFSLCVSLCSTKPLDQCGNDFPFSVFRVVALSEVSSNTNPECISWHLIIDNICRSKAYSVNHRIGLIVDSELDKIPYINRRKVPYYSNAYLPENIQLIYASSGKGKEYLTNQMISYCDKRASELIEFFRKNAIDLRFEESRSNSFKGYKYLRVSMETAPLNSAIRVKHSE